MRYHAHTSPRTLSTVTDPIRLYPAHWELMRWYDCWRKYPYPTDLIAALIADERPEEYRHYPCPVNPEHWHIGRGGNHADPKYRSQRAKRSYRKAVRDEIRTEIQGRQRVVHHQQGD